MKVIFWDFDGVLHNSNAIRDWGFKEVLKEYPKEQLDALLQFHRANGGLSRYVKFRYFFEEIRNEELSGDRLNQLCTFFSQIMMKKLVDQELMIPETINFIKKNYKKYSMHIVSGSDENELKYLCSSLGISPYFKTINGSPMPKKDLVKKIMDSYNYKNIDCLLIGDSINDLHAAQSCNIAFMGYNNPDIEALSNQMIKFN